MNHDKSTIILELDARGAEQSAQSYERTMATLDARYARVIAQENAAANALAKVAAQYAITARAANDNVGALDRVASAMAKATRVIVEHPIATAAAVAASSRALGTLSPALTAASVATAKLANDNHALGGAATLAARGLAASASATASASLGAQRLAETLSPAVAGTRLLATAAGVAVPALGAIGVALVALKVGSEILGKANGDLEKLVRLGEQSTSLDVSAGFIKGFEKLGTVLGKTSEQMDAVLAKASSFVADRFGETNKLVALLDEIEKKLGKTLGASAALKEPTSNEDRIRIAADAMRELWETGQR
jgi:hypothetical protein